MSDKRPKGTFQDRYNKPDSAIPPLSERIFYMVFKYMQESFAIIEKWECVLSVYQKVHTFSSKNDLIEKYALNDPSAIELFKSLHEKHKVLLDTMTKH
jgi:hypothetical protein